MRFAGPFRVLKVLSDTDYVVKMPERRRTSRVCHINMLKAYHSREECTPKKTTCAAVATITAPIPEIGQDDRCADLVSPRVAQLNNSEMLKILPETLGHLEGNQQQEIVNLVSEYPCLFSYVPSRAAVLEHDIDVRHTQPIKQHPYSENPTKRKLMR